MRYAIVANEYDVDVLTLPNHVIVATFYSFEPDLSDAHADAELFIKAKSWENGLKRVIDDLPSILRK